MTKRSGKRQSPLERKATQHQDFVGSADADRAESLFLEHERIERDREEQSKHDGAMGSELPFGLPRPADLRKRARERLEKLPEPAQKAWHVAESAAQVMLVPVRMGFSLAREIFRLPVQLLHVFREA